MGLLRIDNGPRLFAVRRRRNDDRVRIQRLQRCYKGHNRRPSRRGNDDIDASARRFGGRATSEDRLGRIPRRQPVNLRSNDGVEKISGLLRELQGSEHKTAPGEDELDLPAPSREPTPAPESSAIRPSTK